LDELAQVAAVEPLPTKRVQLLLSFRHLWRLPWYVFDQSPLYGAIATVPFRWSDSEQNRAPAKIRFDSLGVFRASLCDVREIPFVTHAARDEAEAAIDLISLEIANPGQSGEALSQQVSRRSGWFGRLRSRGQLRVLRRSMLPQVQCRYARCLCLSFPGNLDPSL
jgi:hypothetical protein